MPSLTTEEMQSFATRRGLGVLQSIEPGEGFWLNVASTVSLELQADKPFILKNTNLVRGWNLAATGEECTPSAFHRSLSATPPADDVVPNLIKTLWVWNHDTSKWYFYSPALEAQGGLGQDSPLVEYISRLGYLDFTQDHKTLGNGIGFWVNKR